MWVDYSRIMLDSDKSYIVPYSIHTCSSVHLVVHRHCPYYSKILLLRASVNWPCTLSKLAILLGQLYSIPGYLSNPANSPSPKVVGL